MALRIKTKLFGDWQKSKTLLNNATGVTAAMHAAVMVEAQGARRAMVKGIRNQSPAGQDFLPLSPITLAIRRAKGFRGTKALIVTGALIKSIQVKTVGPGVVFVGVLRNARSADGKLLFNIARVNELGTTITIRVTPRMKAWLMIQLRDHFMKGKRGRDRRSGRYTKGRFIPSGRGQLRRGVILIRIPPRPFVRPVIEDIIKDPKALAARFTLRVARRLGLAPPR